MGTLYTSTSVNNYNANPPPDDGTQTPQNLVQWATIKSKLSDPLNTFASSVDSNITSAFGKTLDGASIVSTAVDYAMSASDQGRLIKVTVSGKVVTTPDAGTVGAPFIFAVLNNSNGTISLNGNATNTQTVDGLTSQSISPGGGCICKTDGTNWNTFGLSNVVQGLKPQGYLTLSSDIANSVLTSDVTAATTVYYNVTGTSNQYVPIYTGSVYQAYTFSQKTLTLNNPAHAASTLYDVFAFLNAGVLTIGTGPAWTNSGAGTSTRGTGAGTTQISVNAGLWVNANSMTARNGATTYNVASNQGTYLGTIFIDGTAGQISCHVSAGQSRKWGVWNAFNRLPITLQVQDTTSSWNYKTATWRAANNNSANSLTVLTGLPEEIIYSEYQDVVSLICSSNAISGFTGIGWNSTSATSGLIAQGTNNASASAVTINQPLTAKYFAPPTVGINTVTALEQGDAGAGTATWRGLNGSNQVMQLTSRYNG